MKKFNSGLLLVGVAASGLALSGVAHAAGAAVGSLDGAYSKAGAVDWSLQKEGAGVAKPVVPLTADQQAAADAVAAQKSYVTSTLLGALGGGTATAYSDYKTALAAQTTAGNDQVAAATTLSTKLAAKTASDALVTTVAAQVADAATKLSAAQATYTTAAANYTTVAANPASTPAQIAAALAAKNSAQEAVNIATEAKGVFDSAYTTALATQATKNGEYTAAITAKAAADSAVITANAAVVTKNAALTAALTADTGFAGALAAVNAAAGTTFAASYDGLKAIEAYDDPAPAAKWASNGVNRANSLLSSAAALSSGTTNGAKYIAMASGALTGSAAALDVGAHFETEVLGALTDHEGRITANTAAISAETNARIAADNAIKSDLANEVLARKADIAAQQIVNTELRDRIASSTATAIALGGSTILPDTNFTLSGNVGFYQGAQAVALNAAARVGPKAYVTAAAGGGLNKHGEFGGRVGFVFGF